MVNSRKLFRIEALYTLLGFIFWVCMMVYVFIQVKLKGNPWSEMFHGDGYHGRALLLALLTSYTALGWRLVCSADVSSKYIHQQNGPDYPLDVQSWYFMYDESLLANPPPPPVGFPAPAPVGFPTAPPVEFAAPPPTYEATFQQ